MCPACLLDDVYYIKGLLTCCLQYTRRKRGGKQFRVRSGSL